VVTTREGIDWERSRLPSRIDRTDADYKRYQFTTVIMLSALIYVFGSLFVFIRIVNVIAIFTVNYARS